ncbi:WYL domain-containing protein [Rhodococcus fascians]|nr:WYL domain-containing protein [Rhodococcus fascians]MBY4395867.1 WYL domain-containing protein [Rhodococcus fascians]MBY4406822.1 WYL domain-containing protein [Rhodococcus fascians]MBY4420625.1 WYL domain-containing protein [Rhodococcus fascians]MBY4459722.1 WYL domain-containing protein [Rhodococcus fascians]
MRADRLLSIVMLLQHRGRLNAADIAAQLEVSTRTVLRDIEALSSAGIPVYTDRGRGGGISLLQGYRTELTGLTAAEATALLASGAGRVATPAFASAMRKVIAAIPDAHRAAASTASQRILVRPDGFAYPHEPEEHLVELQRVVIDGMRIRITYRDRSGSVNDRILDPIGLVYAGDHWYLLAGREGTERVYRVSRIDELTVLDEQAHRASTVDLEAAFTAHWKSFRASLVETEITCTVEESAWLSLSKNVVRVIDERIHHDGKRLVVIVFSGHNHALGALWNCGPGVEVLQPTAIREELAARAFETYELYR